MSKENKDSCGCKGLIGSVVDWVDYRLPIFTFLKHQGEYRAPKNLSYLWSFGSLAGIGLLVQIITGIVLSMHYTPHVDMAFDSVERIMRDVHYGWLIRYAHAAGGSMFFFAVYMHILRGMYYGSYKKPRELVWGFGVVIYLMMMATGFTGYVLPWGQMSFWAATVITNLFAAFPVIGQDLVQFLWGGFSVDNPTLNRFFSLHFLIPLIIFVLVLIHLIALHIHGSNNPTGVEPKSDKDTVPFSPFYTIKDFVGFGFFFMAFAAIIFFAPNYLGHADNYIPANPMVTPTHIVPEWFFLPFYAMLRAIPDKLIGVAVMGGASMILIFLPWLDTHKTKSGRYRPVFKWFFWVFVASCLLLGWLGTKPAEGVYITLSRIGTAYYFGYFLIILPLLSKFEKGKTPPESISADIAAKNGEK